MLAAEKLFAEQGVENVSVRAIVKEAGQRNESALQYHFGDRDGLIRAIQKRRNDQVVAKRREVFEELRSEKRRWAVRDFCTLMVKPVFLLCRSDSSFRSFIGVFGHLLLTTRRSVIGHLERQNAVAMREIRQALLEELNDMDEGLFSIRLEDTVRFAVLSLSKRAREGGSFRGARADFFISNLIDTMAAMIAAPMSPETRRLEGGMPR